MLFFSLDWVWFLICCLELMLALGNGLALLQIFFFFQILVKKKKFWDFFCLKVEKIILLLLFKGVPDFALEGVHIFF